MLHCRFKLILLVKVDLSGSSLGRNYRADEGICFHVNHCALSPFAFVRHLGRNQYVVTILHIASFLFNCYLGAKISIFLICCTFSAEKIERAGANMMASALDWLERITVHAVPIGVGGEAEVSIGGRTAAAATEKTASVAGNLIAGDGDVLKEALLDDIVVGIESGHGELGQHILLGVRQGIDVVNAIGGYRSAWPRRSRRPEGSSIVSRPSGPTSCIKMFFRRNSRYTAASKANRPAHEEIYYLTTFCLNDKCDCIF